MSSLFERLAMLRTMRNEDPFEQHPNVCIRNFQLLCRAKLGSSAGRVSYLNDKDFTYSRTTRIYQIRLRCIDSGNNFGTNRRSIHGNKEPKVNPLGLLEKHFEVDI